MKILLIGEYSSLHWTLAEGLRKLGHSVTVASDGDGFKNYPRDIDITRNSSSIKDTIKCITSIYKNLNSLKGYDIVQLINPSFTNLNVEINILLYRFLKKNNHKVFLGAFGDDSFWVKACIENRTFRYSEFYVDGKQNHLADNDKLQKIWIQSRREKLNNEIAESCDGIVACLYEYYAAYLPYYPNKLKFIPLPINTEAIQQTNILTSDKINFFIGINNARSEFKGTNLLYKVLLEINKKYPSMTNVSVAETVSYQNYLAMIQNSDIVLDQIYSFSPAMNGLLTLAMGKILVSGGEYEMYDLLNEKNNQPIVNILPNETDIYNKLEGIIFNKNNLVQIGKNSRQFTEDHHDYVKISQKYLDFWISTL